MMILLDLPLASGNAKRYEGLRLFPPVLPHLVGQRFLLPGVPLRFVPEEDAPRKEQVLRELLFRWIFGASVRIGSTNYERGQVRVIGDALAKLTECDSRVP